MFAWQEEHVRTCCEERGLAWVEACCCQRVTQLHLGQVSSNKLGAQVLQESVGGRSSRYSRIVRVQCLCSVETDSCLMVGKHSHVLNSDGHCTAWPKGWLNWWRQLQLAAVELWNGACSAAFQRLQDSIPTTASSTAGQLFHIYMQVSTL
jgi:hypothetical protein